MEYRGIAWKTSLCCKFAGCVEEGNGMDFEEKFLSEREGETDEKTKSKKSNKA